MADSISTYVPVQIVSEPNRRDHWSVKRKRAKGQRDTARWAMKEIESVRPRLPVHVKLTRIGLRLMDDDNLAASLKAVRDGIADEYMTDDSPGAPITWEYAQIARKDYGVLVQIERREDHGQN